MNLKAPFPWFGGKSRVAHLVWERFGDVPNYVEPFFGSGAVLLMRPSAPRIETVNDADCYLANFWRAIQQDPEKVADLADWPVNEADLHARHQWLVKQKHFRERMMSEPDFCDAKIAAWWAWGISQWIGGSWCQPRKELDRADGTPRRGRPILSNKNGFGQTGIHKKGLPKQLPDIGGNRSASGRGVHSKRGRRTHLGRSFQLQATARRDGLMAWFEALQTRLRSVRVCCGDWSRIMGPSPTTYIGVTGVFLDPPYSDAAGRNESLYAVESLTVAHAVREWALAHQDDPKLRIALCGYEGEHTMPESWECVPWKASGGYANRSGKNENAARERIWFSPHCVRPNLELFSRVAA